MRVAVMTTGLRWLWLTVTVIVLDQISKQWASSELLLHEPVALMPSLNLMLAHNSGAAFSFLSSASGWQRWFFVVLALGVSIALLIWLYRLTARQNLQACALALILGGALGNVLDRLYYGYVIDFFDVYYGSWHWPVFNIADSAITLGAVLLIIDMIRESVVYARSEAASKVETETKLEKNKHD